MRRVTLCGFALVLLVAASTALWQGCGLDPSKKPPDPPVLPEWPPLSPADVMDNMKYAYEHFDDTRYIPLIDLEFQFVVWADDIPNLPPGMADDGVWYYDTEIVLAQHMLDDTFVPEDDANSQIDNMTLEWSFSDPPDTVNFEGAPDHLLSAFVNFDLQVNTVSTMVYMVHSRPLFYFVPNTEVTPWTYSIWRVEDGANLNNPN